VWRGKCHNSYLSVIGKNDRFWPLHKIKVF
jgi:hypothetical protein